MKKFLLSTTAAIALASNALYAQSITDQIVSQLQAQGYESIEIENGQTQIKVEAILNGRKLEVVYDALTGVILKEEVSTADDDDTLRRGVRISSSDDDFLDDDEDDNDDDDHDDDEDEDDNDDNDDDDTDSDRDDEDDNDEDDNDDDDNDD
ncbi:PepSY domain-containing protein [Yoonia sp. TsM2_T14_4]|uniref:PepSY domain-containing protein n=1 Tax=Yoonia sp. TsM2_T14_4 TaxID=3415141 RepID=UPI003C718C02